MWHQARERIRCRFCSAILYCEFNTNKKKVVRNLWEGVRTPIWWTWAQLSPSLRQYGVQDPPFHCNRTGRPATNSSILIHVAAWKSDTLYPCRRITAVHLSRCMRQWTSFPAAQWNNKNNRMHLFLVRPVQKTTRAAVELRCLRTCCRESRSDWKCRNRRVHISAANSCSRGPGTRSHGRNCRRRRRHLPHVLPLLQLPDILYNTATASPHFLSPRFSETGAPNPLWDQRITKHEALPQIEMRRNCDSKRVRRRIRRRRRRGEERGRWRKGQWGHAHADCVVPLSLLQFPSCFLFRTLELLPRVVGRLPPSLLECWRLHTALPPCSSGTTFVVQFLPNFCELKTIFYMASSKLCYALLDLKKVVIFACLIVMIYIAFELLNY